MGSDCRLAGFCTHGSLFMDRSYPTMRVCSPKTKALLDQGDTVLFAVNHGSMIGLLRLLPERAPLSVLISQSRDGEIIARACTAMGFSIARGSEKRGAVQGALQMVKAADKGKHLVVLFDGPRGPRDQVKNGLIKMAQLTKLPIVPVAISSREAEYMWGWDSFQATHWGAPILHLLGDPITVPQNLNDEELETARDGVEQALNNVRAAANAYWRAAS